MVRKPRIHFPGAFYHTITRYFNREPMTISQAIIKVERLIQRDKEADKTVGVIEKGLTGTSHAR